eukprot:3179022-Rhodomonas_salina.2
MMCGRLGALVPGFTGVFHSLSCPPLSCKSKTCDSSSAGDTDMCSKTLHFRDPQFGPCVSIELDA